MPALIFHPPILRRLPAAVGTELGARIPRLERLATLGADHRPQGAAVRQRAGRIAGRSHQGATCQMALCAMKPAFTCSLIQALASAKVKREGAATSSPLWLIKAHVPRPRGAFWWERVYSVVEKVMVCLRLVGCDVLPMGKE
jgi:hypothetical protein